MDENTCKVLMENNLRGVIRLTKNEYPKELPTKLTVFVVSPTTTVCGKYLMPKIIKFGQNNHDGTVKEYPKLSFKNIFIGVVFRVQDDLKINSLRTADFKFSLSKIGNQEDLLRVIKVKYKKTRPYLDLGSVRVSKIDIKNLKYFRPKSQII